jgi:UDPglucose--hexose-1-phosphate uridylyltransferase
MPTQPQPTQPTPTRLIDSATGRPVLMAPGRRLRPVHTAELDAAGPCPFCPGNEAMTPPQVDAEPAGTQAAGWVARAFPNLYPAAEGHEVIAEGAVHATQPASLSAAVWRAVLALYRRRLAALEARHECAFLFKNVGWRAGASIAHNHTQILGLDTPTPRLARMVECLATQRQDPLAADVAQAAAEDRVVFANARYLVHSPRVPKLPFETWLSPRSRDDDFLTPADPEGLADALHALFVAVDAAFDAPAFNAYLLRDRHARFPWHLELQPRTGNLAGLELGGDMYINSVPAAESAERLRRGLARSAH